MDPRVIDSLATRRRNMIKGALTFRHPENYLFFTENGNGRRAAREFLARPQERTENRDGPTSMAA